MPMKIPEVVFPVIKFYFEMNFIFYFFSFKFLTNEEFLKFLNEILIGDFIIKSHSSQDKNHFSFIIYIKDRCKISDWKRIIT